MNRIQGKVHSQVRAAPFSSSTGGSDPRFLAPPDPKRQERIDNYMKIV